MARAWCGRLDPLWNDNLHSSLAPEQVVLAQAFFPVLARHGHDVSEAPNAGTELVEGAGVWYTESA